MDSGTETQKKKKRNQAKLRAKLKKGDEKTRKNWRHVGRKILGMGIDENQKNGRGQKKGKGRPGEKWVDHFLILQEGYTHSILTKL